MTTSMAPRKLELGSGLSLYHLRGMQANHMRISYSCGECHRRKQKVRSRIPITVGSLYHDYLLALV
jgi:hypothetical protein